MAVDLKQALHNWNGKSAQDIGDIYSARCQQDDFMPEVVSLMADLSLQRGATWLLKHALASGFTLKDDLSREIFGLLTALADWQSRLHLLQSLPSLPIPVADKQRLELFLRACLSDSNKFVRAWAYNGFYLLACAYPEYREEVRQFFQLAMQDEPASVKARLRNIQREMDW